MSLKGSVNVSVGILGEEGNNIITLLNGFTISIEFDSGNGGWMSSRYYAESRRIRVYDNNKVLLSELVEKNPHLCEHKTRVKEHLKKLGYPKPNAYKHDPNKMNIIL